MGVTGAMLEVFINPSNLVGARNSVAVLQALFFDRKARKVRGHYALDHVVRIADAFELDDVITALAAKLDGPGVPTWLKIFIAKALLPGRNLHEANVSAYFLLRNVCRPTTDQDSSWKRKAAEALIAGVKRCPEYPFEEALIAAVEHCPDYPFDSAAGEMSSSKSERSLVADRVKSILALMKSYDMRVALEL